MPTSSTSDRVRSTSFPGAAPALVLLLLINLFNNIDRFVLAAVIKPIKQTFFVDGDLANQDGILASVMNWFKKAFTSSRRTRSSASWGRRSRWFTSWAPRFLRASRNGARAGGSSARA